MDHVAYMKKSWRLLEKIRNGSKKMESRWYKTRHLPWGLVKENDTIYFKNSGEPVTLKARVAKVLQFEDLTPSKVKSLLADYAGNDGIAPQDLDYFYALFKDKKLCLFMYLKDVTDVPAFEINKKGFGAQAAWISIADITMIKRES